MIRGRHRPPPAFSWRDTLVSYAFLAPALILLAVFTFYPLAYGAYLGFTEYGGARFGQGLPPKWIGLENFKTLLADPLFLKSLVNSVKYLIVVPVCNSPRWRWRCWSTKTCRAWPFFRAAYYVPVVTSISLAAVMWDWVYNKDGTLNWALGALHVLPAGGTFGWLNNEYTAFWAVMLVTFWRGFGYYMVLYLAGLQGIPSRAGRSGGPGRRERLEALLEHHRAADETHHLAVQLAVDHRGPAGLGRSPGADQRRAAQQHLHGADVRLLQSVSGL